MSTKLTQAPWGSASGPEASIYALGGQTILRAAEGLSSEECAAVVRLAQAAPELLSALVELVREVDDFPDASANPEVQARAEARFEKVLGRARGAISNALPPKPPRRLPMAAALPREAFAFSPRRQGEPPAPRITPAEARLLDMPCFRGRGSQQLLLSDLDGHGRRTANALLDRGLLYARPGTLLARVTIEGRAAMRDHIAKGKCHWCEEPVGETDILRGGENAYVHKACEEKGAREQKVSCQASRDGDCDYACCPQLRDGEPSKTGRHCPLDNHEDDE